MSDLTEEMGPYTLSHRGPIPVVPAPSFRGGPESGS
jgi:hypothetical protein